MCVVMRVKLMMPTILIKVTLNIPHSADHFVRLYSSVIVIFCVLCSYFALICLPIA